MPRTKKNIKISAEELMNAIEEIAIKNNISKEEVMESLQEVIKEKVSEILNIDEESLQVDFGEEGIKFKLEQQVVVDSSEVEDVVLQISMEEAKKTKKRCSIWRD